MCALLVPWAFSTFTIIRYLSKYTSRSNNMWKTVIFACFLNCSIHLAPFFDCSFVMFLFWVNQTHLNWRFTYTSATNTYLYHLVLLKTEWNWDVIEHWYNKGSRWDTVRVRDRNRDREIKEGKINATIHIHTRDMLK